MGTLTRTVGPSGDHSKDLALLEQTGKDVLKFSSATRTREDMDHNMEGNWRLLRRYGTQ